METQIATTKEQSARLIAIGIDPTTADMFYTDYRNKPNDPNPLVKTCDLGIRKDLVPAWSLHRLLSLLPEEIVGTSPHFKQGPTMRCRLMVEPHTGNIGYCCLDFIDNAHWFSGNATAHMLKACYGRKGDGRRNLFETAVELAEWLAEEGHLTNGH